MDPIENTTEYKELPADNSSCQQEVKEFLQSIDFMRLGQAVNHEQWLAATMTLRRLEQKRELLQLEEFKRNFSMLKFALQRKNTREAKQILSLIVNKRAQMRNALNQHTPSS